MPRKSTSATPNTIKNVLIGSTRIRDAQEEGTGMSYARHHRSRRQPNFSNSGRDMGRDLFPSRHVSRGGYIRRPYRTRAKRSWSAKATNADNKLGISKDDLPLKIHDYCSSAISPPGVGLPSRAQQFPTPSPLPPEIDNSTKGAFVFVQPTASAIHTFCQRASS